MMSTRDRKWWVLALLLLATPGVLLACGGDSPQGAHPPTATRAPTSTVPPAPTDQSGNGRIAYPWPMQQHKASGTIIWLPSDLRVYEELETDFLVYWTWGGLTGPTSFPFAPDPNQIPILATPDFQGQLQTYLNQVHSQGRVTAYLGSQKQVPQAIQTCTQDGLVCQVYYNFPDATKTTYNTQTGQILSQTKHISLFVLVTQSYNKGAQRWQLSNLVSQEIAG